MTRNKRLFTILLVLLAPLMLGAGICGKSGNTEDGGPVLPTMSVGTPITPTCVPDASEADEIIALHGGLSAMACYNQLWNENNVTVSAKCEGYRASWEDATDFCKGKMMLGGKCD